MKRHYSILLATCLFVVSCSPSLEEVEGIVSSYVAYQETGDLFGGDGSTTILNIEQTDKNIYSGMYSVAKDANTLYAYPFTAIIKKDQVVQFFKDTDDAKVMVITVKPEALAKGENEITEADLVYETKKDYDERIRKEEEERLAAAKRASGSGLAQKGANYLLSGHNGIIQVISYNKASKAGTAFYQKMFGSNIVVYAYKVLEANGYGGTQTSAYDVVFRNGNVIYSHDASEGSDLMDYISLAASLMGQ